MNKIKQTIEKSTNSLDKKVKQKITTSIYGTRIYLFFLTIINFIWLYCMDVKINLFSIISACIILLFLFFLYRKNGKEYMLEIVHSNLFFFSIFFSFSLFLFNFNCRGSKRFFSSRFYYMVQFCISFCICFLCIRWAYHLIFSKQRSKYPNSNSFGDKNQNNFNYVLNFIGI